MFYENDFTAANTIFLLCVYRNKVDEERLTVSVNIIVRFILIEICRGT
jgi:hypothetical protein